MNTKLPVMIPDETTPEGTIVWCGDTQQTLDFIFHFSKIKT